MARYLILGFDEFCPGGGFNDYLGEAPDGADIENVKLEAMQLAVSRGCDYVQVADLKTSEIVWEASV